MERSSGERASSAGREGGRRPGGFTKRRRLKISGSQYQFSKSALYFLVFLLKTNKIKEGFSEKWHQRAHTFVTKSLREINTSFHENEKMVGLKKGNVMMFFWVSYPR